jgi:hypothetical protein
VTVSPARLTASSAYRVATEAVAFEQSHDTPLDALHWYDGSTGGGSVSHVAASAALSVGVSTANGARGLLRSHARPKAAVGKSRTVVVIGQSSSEGVTSQRKRWGLFDDNNGHFFELDGESLYAVRRSDVSGSVVDTRVALTSWTVPTHINVTLSHVWEIRETWPNGDISFFVDGERRHVISTRGSITGPSARTARLPVTVECLNNASTSTGAFHCIAAKVDVETMPLNGRGFSRSVSATGITTSDTPLLCIRPRTTFGSVANLGELIADMLTATCSAETIFKLTRGATITGGTWANHDSASLAEYNATATSFTGGTEQTFVTEGGLALSELNAAISALRLQGDGTTQDTLVISAAAAASTISARVALSWKEVR